MRAKPQRHFGVGRQPCDAGSSRRQGRQGNSSQGRWWYWYSTTARALLPGASTTTPLLLQKPLSKPDSQRIPLFVRVYAHILPQGVFEKSYSHEVVQRTPVPLLTTQSAHPSLSAPASRGEPAKGSLSTAAAATSRFGRNPPAPHTPLIASSARGRVITSSHGHPNTSSGSSSAAYLSEPRTGAEKALCRDILYGVMEALVGDAMNSSVVQEALWLQTQPLPAPMRAMAHARGSVSTSTGANSQLYPRARESDDCQAILASIMDNTVLNILQELFHGDLERELLCVPRKSVFPSSPKSKPLLKI